MMRINQAASAVLAAFWAFSASRTVLACSTGSFGQLYEGYPDCAVACLACQDADYVNNFANNCDYAGGACCTSQYHNVIADTWSCVRDAQSGCGSGLAQTAFDTFVQYCAEKGAPLAAADVPPGYNDTGGPNGSNANGSQPLSPGEKAGIALGAVGGVASIIGAYYTWKAWRKKRQKAPGGRQDTETALQRIHGGPAQRPWEVAGFVPTALLRDGDVQIVYTRQTSTVSLSGYHKTTETYKIGRDTPAQGRVIEEVD